MKESIKNYESPKAEVIETKVQSIICQSNTERPNDTEPGWGWE